MPKAPPNNLAAVSLVAGVLIVVFALSNPAMLGLIVPVALVLLGIYGRQRQQQLQRQRAAAATQFASPPDPEVRQVQPVRQAQPAEPVRQGLQGPQPPNPWWQSQAFPTSQPPPAPPTPAAPPSSPPPAPATTTDPSQVTVAPELHARVEVLRKTGKTVEAIDLLREETGMELYPASRYVLAIEAP